MPKQTSAIETLPAFGLESLISYFKLVDRTQSMVLNQEDVPFADQICLLLIANKILIYNNIKDQERTIKKKKNLKQEFISLPEIDLLKQIENQKFQLIQMSVQCKKALSQSDLQNHKQVCALIQVLRKSEVFRKNELIKFQYFLRRIIQKYVGHIQLTKKTWPQQELALKQKTFIVLDFIISFLQLNAELISNSNWVKFGQLSNIKNSVNHPVAMNQTVLQNIIWKVKVLNLQRSSTFNKQSLLKSS